MSEQTLGLGRGRFDTLSVIPGESAGLVSAVEHTIRAAAFRILLDRGEAASAEDIAKRTGLPIDRTRLVIGELAAVDRIRLDRAGSVAVCGGLSVASTQHRMRGPFGERFTCCAYDALGILGALDADGQIESVSPESGQPIVVPFVRGRPQISSEVLFLADDSCCGSTLADWCPQVNFFEDEAAAERWRERSGVGGHTIALELGTERAAGEWRVLLSLVPSPPE